MTTRSLILAGGLLLATTASAFAQSHQGGYLGLNPGAGVPASHGVAVEHGSGQGGYLGIDPGAHVGPSIQAPARAAISACPRTSRTCTADPAASCPPHGAHDATPFLPQASERVMRRLSLMLGLTGVAIAGVVAWRVLEPPARADVATPPPPIPVQIASATRGDLPVYLTGLGSVQAFNTVTVRSRVDGELQKVAFTEGQMVKPGDLLAQIDPRPFQAQLDQALAKRAQDAAQLADAQINLKRFSDLATREFATRQSVDTQTALVHQLEAAIKGDDAAIENARVQLGYTTIASPLTGRTGIRLVDQGNIVHATDPGGLVVLTQLQPISVVFTLPESQLPDLRTAMQTAPVEAVAVSQDGAQVLDRGTIALVDNLIDQTTGTIKLKATFANAHETLWPGQLLRFRPIMMTTMAALLAALPLALGRGVGSELRRPLGIAIVGGLIVSQLLTLYTTPVIYLAFDRLARRFRRGPVDPA